MSEGKGDEQRARWYVVHTNVRAERMAQRRLFEAGFAAHLPHYIGRRRHAGRIIGIMVPLYPRYIFVEVQVGQALYTVDHTPGVMTVVYSGGRPLEIPAAVMALEMARTDADGKLTQDEVERLRLPVYGIGAKRRHRHKYGVGQRVKITRGAFEGFVATIQSLDKTDALRLWVDVLGRQVAVRATESDISE